MLSNPDASRIDLCPCEQSSAVRAVRYEDDKQHKASVRISNYTRLLSASDGMCARPTCDRCLIADVENLPQISKRGRAQRALSVCSVFSRKSILEEEFVKRLHLPIRFVECSIGPCPSHLCTTVRTFFHFSSTTVRV